MKKIILLAAVFFFVCGLTSIQAQLPNAAGLLKQFTNAIKPSSFLDSWKTGKAGFLGDAGKISSAAGLAKSVSSLAGFLKPGMFKDGFDIKSLEQAAGTAKTMSEAAGLLTNLEGGLKPEAMSDSWAGKRSGWLSALSLLK